MKKITVALMIGRKGSKGFPGKNKHGDIKAEKLKEEFAIRVHKISCRQR